MSKRNITYIKGNEPSFIKKLKLQAGYKEGPTVDTKREDLGPVNEEDLLDNDEEQPTVVVLKPGDLTAEEAAKETVKLEEEVANTPADLNSRIVFKVPDKVNSQDTTKITKGTQEKSKSRKLKNKALLSFDDEENDDN